MPFGFSHKRSREVSFGNLTKEEFLALGIQATINLEWELDYLTDQGFISTCKASRYGVSQEVTLKLNNGSATITSKCVGDQVVVWSRNSENVEQLISTIEELKTTYTAEEIASKAEEVIPHLISREDDLLKLPPATFKDAILIGLSVFTPTEGYFITPILINLNILIFIIGALIPGDNVLMAWGGNSKATTLDGEWWRLITNYFLHFDTQHLVVNMGALLEVGYRLEPYLGKARFLSTYLLCGISASIISLCLHNQTIISVGSSGAIIGMYAFFAILLTTGLIDNETRKAQLKSIVICIVFTLLNALREDVDGAAHLGGLVCGIIAGYAFIPSLKKPTAVNLKLLTIGLLTVFILASSFIVYNTL